MEVNFRELRRHYASLADEELLSIDRDDLTKAAQEAYDQELADRGLKEEPPEAGPAADGDLKPDWSDGGVCVCSFADVPSGTAAEKSAQAQAVLEISGIPSQLKVTEDEEARKELGVIVPGMFAAHSASILDRDLFNEEYEVEWRSQLAMLPDKALLALDPAVFCAGLLDRVARMKRAYTDEMLRRKLPARTA